MSRAPATTVIDLARLSLSHGEGRRLDMQVALDPLELGGQTYGPVPAAPSLRLEISRPSGGYALHLRFAVRFGGPCVRCLADAAVELEVDAREVDQDGTEEEELRSPYVSGRELDVGHWARDAAALALPSQVLCRSDCAGLCPVCGKSLNDAGAEEHRHDAGIDPRWNKLHELEVD
jgi:DUF177 domain-containing protein